MKVFLQSPCKLGVLTLIGVLSAAVGVCAGAAGRGVGWGAGWGGCCRRRCRRRPHCWHHYGGKVANGAASSPLAGTDRAWRRARPPVRVGMPAGVRPPAPPRRGGYIYITGVPTYPRMISEWFWSPWVVRSPYLLCECGAGYWHPFCGACMAFSGASMG